MMNMQRLACHGLLWAALTPLAHAQSLGEFYQSARQHDATFLAAQSNQQATLARGEQAQAAVRPSAALSLGASRTRIGADVVAFDRGAYGSQALTLSAKYPLYNPAAQASADQGKRQADLAQAQSIQAEQDLMVRVAQAYFDVLAARDTFDLTQAQKAAVSEQLAAAKRNFEVGTATITDTREAQARYDLTLAQEIAAENDLRVKQLALEQLTGRTPAQPKGLMAPVKLAAPEPNDIDHWVSSATKHNALALQAQIGLDVAQLETRKAQATDGPSVDLTGAYSITQNNGSSNTVLDYRTNVGTVGVTLNWPLYAGNALRQRVQETIALEDKARADLEAARRAMAQAARAAYLGVRSGLGQVQALEAAQASAQSALDATQLGYQVGVRVNLDVLNAQTALFDTKTRLAKARYDVIMGNLRLRQAAGTLSAADINAVDALLAK